MPDFDRFSKITGVAFTPEFSYSDSMILNGHLGATYFDSDGIPQSVVLSSVCEGNARLERETLAHEYSHCLSRMDFGVLSDEHGQLFELEAARIGFDYSKSSKALSYLDVIAEIGGRTVACGSCLEQYRICNLKYKRRRFICPSCGAVANFVDVEKGKINEK